MQSWSVQTFTGRSIVSLGEADDAESKAEPEDSPAFLSETGTESPEISKPEYQSEQRFPLGSVAKEQAATRGKQRVKFAKRTAIKEIKTRNEPRVYLIFLIFTTQNRRTTAQQPTATSRLSIVDRQKYKYFHTANILHFLFRQTSLQTR